MAFTNTWDEASPPGTDFARTADDHLRKSKTDIRERGGVEHITYVTEGANTDVWEHKSGQCKVAYVGTKATFPATNRKGALAIATDENNTIYHNNGTSWLKIIAGSYIEEITRAPMTVPPITNAPDLSVSSNYSVYTTVFSKIFTNFTVFNNMFVELAGWVGFSCQYRWQYEMNDASWTTLYESPSSLPLEGLEISIKCPYVFNGKFPLQLRLQTKTGFNPYNVVIRGTSKITT